MEYKKISELPQSDDFPDMKRGEYIFPVYENQVPIRKVLFASLAKAITENAPVKMTELDDGSVVFERITL